MIFEGLGYRPELTVCADTLEERRVSAETEFGFRQTTGDWRAAVDHPDVDVVVICAPNMLHCEVVEAAAAASKHVFCEKPVGGTPEQTARAEKACRDAGVVTGVGYNYRFVPLVQHARNLIEAGELGPITNYRGRFFSVYGADPLGLLSWRFRLEQAGHGVSTDILSHAHRPGDDAQRSDPAGGRHRRDLHQGATAAVRVGNPLRPGDAGDPVGVVTNEDYFGAMAVFANGSRGTFEASRTMVDRRARWPSTCTEPTAR